MPGPAVEHLTDALVQVSPRPSRFPEDGKRKWTGSRSWRNPPWANLMRSSGDYERSDQRVSWWALLGSNDGLWSGFA